VPIFDSHFQKNKPRRDAGAFAVKQIFVLCLCCRVGRTLAKYKLNQPDETIDYKRQNNHLVCIINT